VIRVYTRTVELDGVPKGTHLPACGERLDHNVSDFLLETLTHRLHVQILTRPQTSLPLILVFFAGGTYLLSAFVAGAGSLVEVRLTGTDGGYLRTPAGRHLLILILRSTTSPFLAHYSFDQFKSCALKKGEVVGDPWRFRGRA
jgi:hypothetical protein